MDLPELPLMLAACADRAEELGDADTAACLRWLARNATVAPDPIRAGRRAMLRTLIENLDRLGPTDTFSVHWPAVNARPIVLNSLPTWNSSSLPKHWRWGREPR